MTALRVKLRPTAIMLLGIDDDRVVAQYAERGVTFEGSFAVGEAAALDTLRLTFECFVDADEAGTRSSAKAAIAALDKAVQ